MSVPQTQGATASITASLPSARRLALLGVPALVLGASTALAQQQAPTGAKVPTSSKYGGVYHTNTGTWTRPTSQFGAFAADVIYTNTALSGYFFDAGGTGGFGAGAENFDEGGLPGTTNGNPFAIGPDRDTYRVNGYQINYCDNGAALSSGWEISFYQSYLPCTQNSSPITRINSTGLPAGGQCWVIDIDLSGGQEFDIAADGGDGWDDNDDLDSFGWSFRYTGSDPDGGAGFLLAGDPSSTDPGWTPSGPPIGGFGTYYGGPGTCGGTTGYLAQDFWYLDSSIDPTISGCYFFGGYSNSNGCGGTFNSFASYHMEIYAESGEQPSIGTDYCASTANSTGAMSTLTASGSEVATDDAVELSVSDLPASSLAFFITSQTQGNVPNPGGSAGNLCVVGDVGRFMQPGQVKLTGADGTFSLSTTLGEWSTSDIPQATPPLSYAAMAGMTSNFQLWHRDAAMGSATSNFSNGLSITWL